MTVLNDFTKGNWEVEHVSEIKPKNIHFRTTITTYFDASQGRYGAYIHGSGYRQAQFLIQEGWNVENDFDSYAFTTFKASTIYFLWETTLLKKQFKIALLMKKT